MPPQFRKKTSGPHKGQAFPIDSNGNVSPVAKGPSPRGSVPLKKNSKNLIVTIPNTKPSVEATQKPKVPTHPPSTSGIVETREETHK